MEINDETESEIVGGVGEKKSLNNTRWYLQDRIYDSDELATSVCASFNPWYKVDEMKEYEAIDYRYDEGIRGRTENIQPTICDKTGGGYSRTPITMEKNIRIRKLTPKECWRLMGWKDEDFAKAEAVVSNSQLYKQAGNSIVVQVLEAIFKEML